MMLRSAIRPSSSSLLHRTSPLQPPRHTKTFSTSNLPTPTSTTNDVIKPIHMDTSSTISGEESQVLTVQIKPQQILRADPGAMIYMTEGVSMNTSTGGSTSSGSISSGVSEGIKRMLSGNQLFITDFTFTPPSSPSPYSSNTSTTTTTPTSGTVALGAGAIPSKLLPIHLQDLDSSGLTVQKGAFVCMSHPTNIHMNVTTVKDFKTGFFGGEGFILQHFSFPRQNENANHYESSSDEEGTVVLRASGALTTLTLAPQETLRISSGALVAFSGQDLQYNVTTMPGFKNVMFGGEGLFVTTLTGPGKVWIQGLPMDRFVSEIVRRIPGGGGGIVPLPIGGGGAGGGGGEAEAEAEAEADSASSADGSGMEEGVPLDEAAVQADRQATVAASGMSEGVDADSPSALFGDAAGDSDSGSAAASSTGGSGVDSGSGSMQEEDFFSEKDMQQQEQQQQDYGFMEDDTTTSFSTENESTTNQEEDSMFSEQDEEFGSDLDMGPSDGDADGGDGDGGGLWSTLWDIFTGGDD